MDGANAGKREKQVLVCIKIIYLKSYRLIIKMKVLILGCGWYGCHCASVLKRLGFSFKIADVSNDFFTGSSSKNQNRLHLGFHYPRSSKTRKECIEGFRRFMDVYPWFAKPVEKNYYMIDKRSIIDFESYEKVMDGMGGKKCDLDLEFSFDSSLVEGTMLVGEMYIDHSEAKNYFKDSLGSFIIHDYQKNLLSTDGCVIYDKEKFDMLIDCTYSALDNMHYEDCVSMIYMYKGNDTFALTLMDGPHWSLYPYDLKNKLYTLTDVENTPKGSEDAREDMERKVKEYIKDFDAFFEYAGCFVSRKAKVCNQMADDRSLVWSKEGNVIRFSGGKITGMFAAEDVLTGLLRSARQGSS